MRTCYVSIPWGVRPDQVGRSLDFDYLYRAVLYPAIQEVEMQCYRLEDLITAGSHWQKQLFTALMSSDLMIADVSTSSANVLYELGIRHALRRGRTIVISASGERIPSNLAELRTLYYEPDGSGCLTGESAAHFRQALQSTIRQSQRTAISDSPIYQYFPGLEVILPPELAIGGHRRQRTSTNDLPGFAQSGLMSSSETTAGVQKTEQEIRSASDPDPVDYLKLLSRYRDLSDWDSFITLATDAPPTVGASPEVRQSLALALNRRAESSGEPSDQARAIAIMTQLIDETGGDSESFGILGRIYKDRAFSAATPGDREADLVHAIDCYQRALKLNPNDYYSASNGASLLLKLKDDPAAQHTAHDIAVSSLAALKDRRADGPIDYWVLSAMLDLAIIARDWPTAEETARNLVENVPERWMLDVSRENLRVLDKDISDPNISHHTAKVLGILGNPLEAAKA